VLLQVLAVGVNNTEINTRLGWYSKTVTTDTASANFDLQTAPHSNAHFAQPVARSDPLVTGDMQRKIAALAGTSPPLTRDLFPAIKSGSRYPAARQDLRGR
jgi:hypothetical protein